MTSKGMKKILGIRQANSDGETYSAGKYKYWKSGCRYKNTINRSKRADKKKARRLDDKYLFETECTL